MNVICENCGKEFCKKIAEIKRSQKHYCSKKCTGIGKQKQNIARFSEFYEVEKNGCWEWKLVKNKDGYGIKRFHGIPQLAHRVSYQIFNGEIGDLQVLHKCDNPSCVNPNHLFLGTHYDNMLDMTNKGRRFSKKGSLLDAEKP